MTNEEAISIMKAIVYMLEEKYDTDRVEEAVDMAIEALQQEPKKSEILTGWTPVGESLPQSHKDVLICLSSNQISIGCYNSHRLPFSNNVIGWGSSYAHNWCSNDVIAWMPLPEPYKAESEKKERK